MPRQARFDFYVRVRVPRELLPLYGKPEIKYSLKTSDGKEAVRRVRIELARIEKDFAERRNNTIVINDLAPRDIRSLPESELREIASTIAMHHLEGDESTRSRLTSREALVEYRDVLHEILHSNDMAAHRQAASSVLGLLHIRFDIGDASFEKFIRLLLESTLKSADVVLARLSGVSIKNEDVIKANELYRPKAAKRLNRLSEVAESVIQAQPLLAGKTYEEKRTIARDFDRWYRGKSLCDLTKRDCQEFADYLQAEGLMGSTIRKK